MDGGTDGERHRNGGGLIDDDVIAGRGHRAGAPVACGGPPSTGGADPGNGARQHAVFQRLQTRPYRFDLGPLSVDA